MADKAVNDLSFPDWVAFIFDHPADGPQWYADTDAPFWNGPAKLTCEHVTRLFEDPVPALGGYSDAQLNMGLNYLISPGLGEHMLCLDDSSVPLADRLRCVRACEPLFRQLLLPRCTPHLSHRDEAGAAPLNAVCYMWWDIMPVYGGPDAADRQALHGAAIDVMANILNLGSLACQESALHGLGHWRSAYPERVESLIEGFLVEHVDARPELIAYARSARCGCVL